MKKEVRTYFEIQKKVDKKIKNLKIKAKVENDFAKHDKKKKNEKNKDIVKHKNTLKN